MTLGERIVFYVSCAVMEASCVMLCVALAAEHQVIWATVAGVVGLLTAHAEARVSDWAGGW